MKRSSFRALFALACTAVLASACYKDDDGNGESAVYGQWMLDTETVTIESSSSAKGTPNRSVVDFSGSVCYLELGVEGASARLGNDFAVAVYSYDPGSKRIDFPRGGLSVSDKGLEFSLSGSYDVTELTDKRMVLTQKSIGIGTTVFDFHKKEDSAGREKRQF